MVTCSAKEAGDSAPAGQPADRAERTTREPARARVGKRRGLISHLVSYREWFWRRSAMPRHSLGSASLGSLGRVTLLRVVEDQDPIAASPLGGGDEFARPGVGILADLAPRPFAGVVPPGFDPLARNPVQ